MRDKGYAHPLFSLDLLPAAALPEDEARYAVPVPEGRLVVRRELRVRAASYPCVTLEEAAAEALAHRRHDPAFPAHGFDEGWAAALQHWTDRMAHWDGHRGRGRLGVQLATEAARGQGALGRRLLLRLSLSSRLAGLAGVIVSGPTPRSRAALLARLRDAARRAADLDAAGFGPAHRAELVSLLRAADSADRERAEAEDGRRRAADALLVVRGAILGDLRLFCQTGAVVLPKERAARLRLGPLLRGAEAVGAAPTPLRRVSP